MESSQDKENEKEPSNENTHRPITKTRSSIDSLVSFFFLSS